MTDQPPRAFYIPPTLLGTTYPTEYVTAMFVDEAAAQAATAALEEVGFKRESMIVAAGDQLLRNERAVRDQRGLGERILAQFPSEEAMIVKQYIKLAEQGYAVLAVYVPESELEQRALAAKMLRENDGSYMHYYGTHTVMDL